jgi:nucleotide-binding universal stress UspA family protein
MVRNRGEVIVGVDDSVTGLRTLREAVATARRRGLELRAVRAYTQGWAWDAGPVRCRQAAAVVDKAFAEAMGGIPDDVPVHTTTAVGPVHAVLVEYVRREDDLLVVGTSRRRWWWPFRRSVGRYCAHCAPCPVLVVPPHAAARHLGGRRLWWRLRGGRELASLVAREQTRESAAPGNG